MREGVSFIVVAAGKGTRFRGGEPKQYAPVAGYPLWKWSAKIADSLFSKGLVDELVLVVPPEGLERVSGELPGLGVPVTLETGGSERGISVMRGLAAARGRFVLVHDAARPLVSEELCRKLIAEARNAGGAIPVVPVTDALKRLQGKTVASVGREGLYRAQTPQAFEREPLMAAMAGFGPKAADESEAWIAAGRPLAFVPGETANFKVTYPEDLSLAEKLLSGTVEWRTGHGYDVHPLVPGRPLVLGGIRIPSSLGLEGHSDADCICHSASDALLGAAGLPDIGTLFPASDPSFKNFFSLDIFRDAAKKVQAEGWVVRWLDITLVAQVPKLGHLLGQMRATMEEALGSPSAGLRRINIKVKSGEAVGPVGEGKCMECHAIATLSRRS
ncbi:MAG: 2-C-methyl-D-erythritol 2,4-cyclodiphosphate synthase [Synergistaceae bacterium]|nr:2-C-methyl-D-erythritol 2,4-cyclodiphosphate synthase [Synergistaceae bacterium]